MPNINSVVDFFPTVFENTVTMTLGNTIAPGATTVPVNGMTNYSNGDVVVFTVDAPTATLKQVFTGTVSGTNVENVVWTYGTNQTHTTGAPIIDYVSATTMDMVTAGILVQHTQTGTHHAITTDTITSSGAATFNGLLTPNGGLSANSVESTALALSNALDGTNGVQSYSNAGSAGGTFYYINLGGIKMLWGTSASCTLAGSAPQTDAFVVDFPSSFFNTIQSAVASPNGPASGTNGISVGSGSSPSTASWGVELSMTVGANGSTPFSVEVKGT